MTNIGISTMGLQTPSLKERFQPVIENIKNGWSELKLHEEYLINGFWWHPDTVAKVKQLGVSSLNDWDRAIAFDKLLPSKTVSGAMEVNDFAVKNWRNIWLTRGLLALGALVGAVFFCPGFIGGGGGGGDGNGPDIPKTPTPDGNDCGALIAAWNGLADQLQVNQQSIMSVDAANIDSPQEVIPELQVCFPKLAVNSVDLVLKTDTHTVFSMLVPDTDKDGAGIRPALGVAFNNQINDEGNVPMLIVDASDANLSALRGDKGKIVVKLGEACIVDGGVAGCSDTVVVIEAVDDGLQKFQFQILGDTAWNIDNNAPVELTADQVSNMNGGGWILGIAQAVKDNETAIAVQGAAGMLEGVGPDITQVQGVGGNVGGEAHDPFSPDSVVIEKIRSQGFMIVTESGVACLRSDGTMVSKVTDQIFSNIDPRDIFKLEMNGGSAVVHVENGANFVYYGEYIDGVFWPRQKEIIGMPGAFGDQLECGGIIVKNLAELPAEIAKKMNLKIGDKLLAVMAKDGTVLDAIPAIADINDEVSWTVVGEGHIRKTVVTSDGQVKIYDLSVDLNLFAPSLPPELLASLPDGYQIVDNQVIVNGQAWYEMTPEKNWQATDWKILEDAPMKISWLPEKYWRNSNGITSASSWPVATGESAVERTMVLNGKEMTVTVLPAIIRDMLDPKIIRNVFVPLIYKDKNGQVLFETVFVTIGGQKSIADLLQSVQRGQQLELAMSIYFSGGRGACLSYDCEIEFDLIAAQGLNLQDGILNNNDILPVLMLRDFLKSGSTYQFLNN